MVVVCLDFTGQVVVNKSPYMWALGSFGPQNSRDEHEKTYTSRIENQVLPRSRMVKAYTYNLPQITDRLTFELLVGRKKA